MYSLSSVKNEAMPSQSRSYSAAQNSRTRALSAAAEEAAASVMDTMFARPGPATVPTVRGPVPTSPTM